MKPVLLPALGASKAFFNPCQDRDGSKKHCYFATAASVRTVLCGPSGKLHLALRCRLAQITAGKLLPKRFLLSLIQLGAALASKQ